MKNKTMYLVTFDPATKQTTGSFYHIINCRCSARRFPMRAATAGEVRTRNLCLYCQREELRRIKAEVLAIDAWVDKLEKELI